MKVFNSLNVIIFNYQLLLILYILIYVYNIYYKIQLYIKKCYVKYHCIMVFNARVIVNNHVFANGYHKRRMLKDKQTKKIRESYWRNYEMNNL